MSGRIAEVGPGGTRQVPEMIQEAYDKANPRRLEMEDRMLILLPTDSNKLLMQWRGPYTVESRVGANDYRVKMGSTHQHVKEVHL